MISLKNIRDRVGIVENAVATRERVNPQIASKVHNAQDYFAGKTASEVRCGGSCSWNCSSGCSASCTSCSGAGKIVAAAASDEWDVAFMAIDPLRAGQILFTPPYLIIEGTYLVRSDSPFRSVEEIDRAGVRIAVGKGAAYDLFLTRTLMHAELVRAPSTAAVIGVFDEQHLDAAAGIRLSSVSSTSR